MQKRTAIVVFSFVAVLGFFAGRALLPTLRGRSVEATAPSGLTRNPDTGSGQGSPYRRDPSSQTDAIPGQASPDPSDAENPEGVNEGTYWIDVDVTSQQVRVMQGDEAVRTMTASTGVEGKETPLGTFEIQNRGEWFFSEKYQQGAKYWVSFKDWGIYLFHSLAMDGNQQVIPEEAGRLGQPASHGCVRLPIEDAKWIYDNIPAKSRVIIHE